MAVTGGLLLCFCELELLWMPLFSLLPDDVDDPPTERSSLETLAGVCCKATLNVDVLEVAAGAVVALAWRRTLTVAVIPLAATGIAVSLEVVEVVDTGVVATCAKALFFGGRLRFC
jgi:hypothetical protein